MTEATPLSPQSILVLGAGELGLPVLRNLVRVAKRAPGSQISVLLRESTINTQIPEKRPKSMSFAVWAFRWSQRTW